MKDQSTWGTTVLQVRYHSLGKYEYLLVIDVQQRQEVVFSSIITTGTSPKISYCALVVSWSSPNKFAYSAMFYVFPVIQFSKRKAKRIFITWLIMSDGVYVHRFLSNLFTCLMTFLWIRVPIWISASDHEQLFMQYSLFFLSFQICMLTII